MDRKSNIKEIYFKIKGECELPLAQLGYTYVDFDKVIQIGRTLCVDFNEDEKNIKQMEELSTRAGFMFFNNSNEGKFWFKNNPIKMTNHG